MKEKILELLQAIQPDADFANSQNFLDDGLIDSVDVVMITTALEDEFGASIPGHEITPENYASIDSLVTLVGRYAKR